MKKGKLQSNRNNCNEKNKIFSGERDGRDKAHEKPISLSLPEDEPAQGVASSAGSIGRPRTRLAALRSGRVLAIVVPQLLVQLRVPFLHLGGLLDEALGRDGQELGGIDRAVGVQYAPSAPSAAPGSQADQARLAKDLPDECFVFRNFEVTTGRGLPYEWALTQHSCYTMGKVASPNL
jgi:hypothetical protein